jgi:hypothetical protein
MLAHHTYPKDAPESKALRNAFTCSGVLICMVAILVVLDVAIRNDFATRTFEIQLAGSPHKTCCDSY